MLSSLTPEIFRARAERGTRPPTPLGDGNRRVTLMTPPWVLEIEFSLWPLAQYPLESIRLPRPEDCSPQHDRLGPRSLPSDRCFCSAFRELIWDRDAAHQLLQRNFDVRALPLWTSYSRLGKETAISLFSKHALLHGFVELRIATQSRDPTDLSPKFPQGFPRLVGFSIVDETERAPRGTELP